MANIESIGDLPKKTVAAITEYVPAPAPYLYSFLMRFTDDSCMRLNVDSAFDDIAWIRAELNPTDD